MAVTKHNFFLQKWACPTHPTPQVHRPDPDVVATARRKVRGPRMCPRERAMEVSGRQSFARKISVLVLFVENAPGTMAVPRGGEHVCLPVHQPGKEQPRCSHYTCV